MALLVMLAKISLRPFVIPSGTGVPSVGRFCPRWGGGVPRVCAFAAQSAGAGRVEGSAVGFEFPLRWDVNAPTGVRNER
jgi:hypothetical protein